MEVLGRKLQCSRTPPFTDPSSSPSSPSSWSRAPRNPFQIPAISRQACCAVVFGRFRASGGSHWAAGDGEARGGAAAGGAVLRGGGGAGGGGSGGDELGHAGVAPAAAQGGGAGAPGQRHQQGEALRHRPRRHERARRHRHRGHGRHPQHHARRPRRRRRQGQGLGQEERQEIRLRRRRHHQVRGRRQRAVLGVLQRLLHQSHLAGAAEHPERAERRRRRRQDQGHRPSQRRRVQLPAQPPGAVRGPVPHRHRRPHDRHRQIPRQEQRALHRQHLPVPEPVPQRQLPPRLRLLRRRRGAGERQRRALHQRVRRQLRHAGRRAQGRRARRHAGDRRRGRLAHRRRQACQGLIRAAVLRRAAPAAGVELRHAGTPRPAHRGLPVRARRRGPQERGAGQLRAALGDPPVRRPAQVRHGPRRAGPRHGGAGAGERDQVPVQDVVRAEPERQGPRQARRQHRLRLHVRRLHHAGVRLDVQRHGRRRERVVRVQRLLPGAEPEGRGLRLPGARAAHAEGPVHGGVQLHHTDTDRGGGGGDGWPERWRGGGRGGIGGAAALGAVVAWAAAAVTCER